MGYEEQPVGTCLTKEGPCREKLCDVLSGNRCIKKEIEKTEMKYIEVNKGIH